MVDGARKRSAQTPAERAGGNRRLSGRTGLAAAAENAGAASLVITTVKMNAALDILEESMATVARRCEQADSAL